MVHNLNFPGFLGYLFVSQALPHGRNELLEGKGQALPQRGARGRLGKYKAGHTERSGLGAVRSG